MGSSPGDLHLAQSHSGGGARSALGSATWGQWRRPALRAVDLRPVLGGLPPGRDRRRDIVILYGPALV